MRRQTWMAVLLAGVGCGEADPRPEVERPPSTSPIDCEIEVTPLALDEASSLGLSGQDVLDVATERFEALHVRWQEGAEPAVETFSLTFGAPAEVSERELGNPECVPRTWVHVEVPVTVTTSSQHLSAEGVVHLYGFQQDGPQVLVDWPGRYEGERMSTTASGPYLEAAEAKREGLTELFLSLSAGEWLLQRDIMLDQPLGQEVNLNGAWSNDMGSSAGWVYRCFAPLGEPVTCLE